MSLESKLTNKLSHTKKKFLQKEIPKLSKNEHHEIFNIIKQNSDAKFSENARGVYINLKFIDIDTLEKIINFIKYTKEQKVKLIASSISENISNDGILPCVDNNINRVIHTKDSIQKELQRLKEKKNENFVFQHFLDKLSISNIKQFTKDDDCEDRLMYPQLKNSKIHLEGVGARVMKKCRDVNKYGSDLPFMVQDDNCSTELVINKKDEESPSGSKSKLKIETLINIGNNIEDDTEDILSSISDNSDFNNF